MSKPDNCSNDMWICPFHYDKMTIDTSSVKATCEMSLNIVKLAQLLCEKVYTVYSIQQLFGKFLLAQGV